MTYIAIWLWFVGSYMMWEEIRDNTGTRPDPRGAFFSKNAQIFHDTNPHLHSLAYVLIQVLIVVFWPIIMTLGIFHIIKLRLRLKS